jgi:hypothetical protein
MSQRIVAVAGVVIFALLTSGVTIGWPSGDRMVSSQVTDWSPPLLSDSTLALSYGADGTLFARTTDGLLATADLGMTWRSVSLPPRQDDIPVTVAVVPTTPTTFFAGGVELLYKSIDEGQSWLPVLFQNDLAPPTVSGDLLPTLAVRAVSVSPVDPNVVYAIVTGAVPSNSLVSPNSAYAFLRSDDGGNSWITVQYHSYGSNGCVWNVDLLVADHLNPEQVFVASSCRAGSSLFTDLQQSVDRGRTMNSIWQPPSNVSVRDSTMGYPQHLVGRQGASHERMYLAVNRNVRLGGSTLLRTDDSGTTWRQILTYRGGGIEYPLAEPGTWNVQIDGLAFDPLQPDHVFVARSARLPLDVATGRQGTIVSSGVTVSYDGGTTWGDLGRQNLNQIADLVLSPDATHLFLATQQGVRKMLLAP